jgi:hypothetical protein
MDSEPGGTILVIARLWVNGNRANQAPGEHKVRLVKDRHPVVHDRMASCSDYDNDNNNDNTGFAYNS